MPHGRAQDLLEAIAVVLNAVRQEDENTKQIRDPFLYINGPPGSGKSAILIEIAIRCARDNGEWRHCSIHREPNSASHMCEKGNAGAGVGQVPQDPRGHPFVAVIRRL